MLDRAALAAVPEATVTEAPAVARGLDASAAYLASDAARERIAIDPYWPKWDSPWWHMVLVWELGEARRIPRATADAMVAGIDGYLHVFPIHPDDAPGGYDPHLDIACHCALGCMMQVLRACGVDWQRALPWVEPWFARYQMADGGLTCDETAYVVEGECPSSMVGTIAAFEAMLDVAPASEFVARGAAFLVGRALVRGSDTKHNAEERDAARAWGEPTFPRFYFYDTLRGLAALVRWAEVTGARLPAAAVAPAAHALAARFPDGVVHIGRDTHTERMTITPTRPRGPKERTPSTTFPLLAAVDAVGAPSAALTRSWARTRRGLLELIDAGKIA